MMRDKTGLAVVALALAITVSLLMCSSNTSAVRSQVASDMPAAKAEYEYGEIDLLGKDGALCRTPIYAVYGKDFFAEEGFDVTLISADTGACKIGLNNGTIPLVNGDFQFLPSIEESVQAKVIDGLHNGCIKLVVPKSPRIIGVNDPKGKKIAVGEIGGMPYQVASAWPGEAGISAKQGDGEVTFVPYADGNLELGTVRKGDVGVAALWDPLGSIVEESGDHRVAFNLSKDPAFAGKYCCFLYASSKVPKEDPEKVPVLLRAVRKAQNRIFKNPKEAVSIIFDKKYSAIEDKELAGKPIISYEHPSAENHKANSEYIKENILYSVQQLKNIGYLKANDLDVSANRIFEEVDVTSGI